MKKGKILLPAITILLYLISPPLQAVDFSNDGTIQDGDVYAEVFIYDTPPETTEVNMTGGVIEDLLDISTESTLYMSGGSINFYLFANEDSTVELSGGNIAHLMMAGQSTLNMNDGSVEDIFGDLLENGDNPTININGGQCQVVALSGNSQFHMTDGLVHIIIPDSNQPASIAGGQVNIIFPNPTHEPSAVNISGGSVLQVSPFLMDYNRNTLNISDGYVRGISQVQNSVVTITGGDVDPIIDMRAGSTLNVDGAELGTVVAYDNSIINVYGDPVELIHHEHTPQIVELRVFDNSTINITGGHIGLLETVIGPDIPVSPPELHIDEGLIEQALVRESLLEISGGEIWHLNIGHTIANITGGGFGRIFIEPLSEVHFFGGWTTESHDCFELRAPFGEQENVYIHGYFFDFNPHELELRGFWLDGTEFCIGLDIETYHNITLVPGPYTPVNIDIKPNGCPNRMSVKSKGILQVAILGSEELDVNTIDIASIRLAGVEPLRSGYEDVATPVSDNNDCNCTTEGPDGFLDLTLKFKTQLIVDAIGDVNDGDILTLELTGTLLAPLPFRPISGADCVLIKGKHKAHNKADINKDGKVDMADFAIVGENWLQSSIVED